VTDTLSTFVCWGTTRDDMLWWNTTQVIKSNAATHSGIGRLAAECTV